MAEKMNFGCEQPTLRVACLHNAWEMEDVCNANAVTVSPETKQELLHWTIVKVGARNSKRVIDALAKSGELNWQEGEEFEVEEILSHEKLKNVDYYLVKWKGWDNRYNTWEKRENLHCDDLIEDYTVYVKSRPGLKRAITAATDAAKRHKPTDDIIALLDGDEMRGKLTASQLVENLKKLGGFNGVNVMNTRDVSRVTRNPKHRNRKDRKLLLQENLSRWQKQLNQLLGCKTTKIFIENNVDFEGEPDNFEYVVDYKAGTGVTLLDDPVIGCDCGTGSHDCFENRKKCCSEASGHEFAYTRYRRLRIDLGRPIYECNKLCTCGVDCPNRVVQNGQMFKLCIFRTSNGRGWGVKVLQKVKRASFVMEYLGEVITSDEAERRGREYDGACRTYLFDLDINGDENPFTVDGGYYGNISHFVNHSCEPNMTAYCVWINNLDPNQPRIAFFANRDIDRGEELTFDYKMTGDTTNTDENKYRMVCQCGSKNCRGFLF